MQPKNERRIVMSGLAFHAFHGVFPGEKRAGGPFIVDLELTFTRWDKSDRLESTVDYRVVYELTKNEVTETRTKLIEVLAERIAERLLANVERLDNVVVRVHKPHASIPGLFAGLYVEVSRTREG